MKMFIGFIGGIVIMSSIYIHLSYFDASLDFLQQIFSIVGSLSIAVALMVFYDSKDRDRRKSTVEQISFFREEIIPLDNEILSLTRKTKGDVGYLCPKVSFGNNLDDYDFKSPEDKKKFKEQIENYILQKKFDDKEKNHVNLLNLVEQFCLMVVLNKTMKESALNCIKSIFVNIVETNIAGLIVLRKSDPVSFSYTLECYSKWRNEVQTKSSKEAAAEFIEEITV